MDRDGKKGDGDGDGDGKKGDEDEDVGARVRGRWVGRLSSMWSVKK